MYPCSMGFWAKAFRFTAFFLVLFTAGEMVACEMPGSECAVTNVFATPPQGKQLQVTLSQDNHSQDKHSPIADNDNCICCCANTIVSPMVFLGTPVMVSVQSTTFLVGRPFSPAIKIERPPQLS
jgi:hypothetical protein